MQGSSRILRLVARNETDSHCTWQHVGMGSGKCLCCSSSHLMCIAPLPSLEMHRIAKLSLCETMDRAGPHHGAHSRVLTDWVSPIACHFFKPLIS